MSTTNKGLRKCKNCPNMYKSVNYALCNPCRKKRRQENGKKYCSGCGKEFPEKTDSLKTCFKCRTRSKTNVNKKICKFIQEGKRCKNKQINGELMCKDHISGTDSITMDIVKDLSKKNEDSIDENTIKEITVIKQSEYVEKVDQLKSELKKLVEGYIKQYEKGKLYDTSLKENKLYEQENFVPLQDKSYYKDLVFSNFEKDAVEKLEPEIIFIKRKSDIKTFEDELEQEEQIDLYNYFLIYTSSIYGRNEIGRQMKMLIRDKVSGKYLGVLKIGSDFGYCSKTDEAIGWTKKNKFEDKKLNYVVNILACVGLQPVSYNMNIGKLLVSLCFTDVVQKEYKRRYGHYFACVTTFSLYGKGIQYDRLPWIKYKGVTKGFGFQLPITFYNKGVEYLKLLGVDTSKYNKGFSGRVRKLRAILVALGYGNQLIEHGMCRGVYVGYTCSEGQEFLCREVDKFMPMTYKVKNIVTWWKDRWARNRYERLFASKQLKKNVWFNDLIEKRRNCDYVKKHNEKCKEAMGEDVYKDIKKKYMAEYRSNKLDNEYKEIDYVKSDYKLNYKYLGGLIDGDGTICIGKAKDGYCLQVLFAQTNIEIMYVLQSMYGGRVYKRMKKKNESDKREYKFRVCGNEARKILTDLENGSILKLKQVKLAIEYLELINKPDIVVDKESYYKKIQELNLSKNKENIHLPYDSFTDEYMTGLFDSEGCICVTGTSYGTVSVGIAQKSNVLILNKFKERYGYGRIYENKSKNIKPTQWIVSDRESINKLLKILIHYSFIKSKQVESALNISENVLTYKKGSRVSDDDILLRKSLKDIIQRDKHDSIEIDVDIIADNNSKHTIKVKKSKIIKKSVVNTVTSMMKKDEHGGYNKGSKMSIEHRANISKAQKSNGKLSDNDIEYILSNQNSMMKQDLAKKFGVSRQYISRIIKESKLSDSERLMKNDMRKKMLKEKKDTLSDEEYKTFFKQLSGIERRSIDFDTIIEILKLKGTIGVMKLTRAKKFLKKDGKPISRDMISNIWTYRTKLYEHEFDGKDITYEEYLDMVK